MSLAWLRLLYDFGMKPVLPPFYYFYYFLSWCNPYTHLNAWVVSRKLSRVTMEFHSLLTLGFALCQDGVKLHCHTWAFWWNNPLIIVEYILKQQGQSEFKNQKSWDQRSSYFWFRIPFVCFKDVKIFKLRFSYPPASRRV